MKINKLNESAARAVDRLLTEDTSLIRGRVRQYLEDTLNHAFDNIAVVLVNEVEGYDAEWCEMDVFASSVKEVASVSDVLLVKMENMLFANAPVNECYDKYGHPEKCEKCITMLNDMGTCPKCDDGEEDLEECKKAPCTLDEAVFSYEIGPGDLVDFGAYGRLYVCDPSYSEDYYWVTDVEEERYNQRAPGWSIEKHLAIDIIDEEDKDLDEGIVATTLGTIAASAAGEVLGNIIGNKLSESADDTYTFIGGDEVLAGLVGNVSDDELDQEIKLFKRISRMLGLARPEDINCFVDTELTFDPMWCNGVEHTSKNGLSRHELNDIVFCSQIINGNLWIYFKSEADGRAYLDYANENI